jgi:putative ABC transport system permease protein
MLSNYLELAISNLKITYRSLLQNKMYSLINISGLAIALSVVLLIVLYIKDDLSFDKFHKNGDQIYRLVVDYKNQDNTIRKSGNSGFIQGPIFKEEIPEIASYCRFKNGWNTLVKKENDAFMEELMYADPEVCKMFSFDFIEGNPENALNNINSVVITEKMAQKYFNSNRAVGKILHIGDQAGELHPFEVTGIIKSLPSNSSIQFDLLCNIQFIINKDQIILAEQSWYNSNLNTFILINKNTRIDHLAQKIEKVTQAHLQAEYVASVKSNPQAQAHQLQYKIQPFYDMHLDPEYFASNGMKYWSDVKYPKILSGIAILLILIATINFVNLSLARSLKRSKEIGIRKTTGSTRWQLFTQFLGESMLTTALAAIPGFILALALIPAFSDLTGKFLSSQLLYSPFSILLYVTLIILIATLAGMYPAFVMSGFQPIDSLKGKALFGTKNRLRQSLVIFQFALASVLMIGTAFVTQQFRFINSKPLGYEIENRYRFWLPWEEISKIGNTFKSEIRKLSDVELVSSKSGDFNKTRYTIEGKQTDWIYYEHIDENHLQLMGIPLVTGRYFSNQYSNDTTYNIIVNETFVKNILPKNVDPLSFPLKGMDNNLTIVGVVKDFHYADFKEKIEPMVFILDRGTQAGLVHIKIKEGKDKEALAAVQATYKKFVPFLPIEYESLQEFRLERYSEEIREKKIVTYTAILAIIIACLGLFGLATFMTEQRTKEIGIRKVFGAGVSSITMLLSKEFVGLVMIAFVIAVPLGFYFTKQWLDNFSYRIDIDWWVFILVGIIALIIALGTVSYQSIQAALTNPSKVLRSE